MNDQFNPYTPIAREFSFHFGGYDFVAKYVGSRNVTAGFEVFVNKNGQPVTFQAWKRTVQVHGSLLYPDLTYFRPVKLYRPNFFRIKDAQYDDPDFFNCEVRFPKENRRESGWTLAIPDDIHTQLEAFVWSEYRRFIDEITDAIERGIDIEQNSLEFWIAQIASDAGNDVFFDINPYQTEPTEIVRMFRERQSELQERDRVWDKREKGGKIVVVLQRCWECGTTTIKGQMLRSGRIEKMPKDLWKEAVQAKDEAHRRSLEGLSPDTIISSVGFNPDPNNKFEFVISDENFYCGC